MSLDTRFAEAMGQALGPDFPSEIGLAVSGGGDSMAMLTLAHNWTRSWGVRLWVLTVDHGLRTESAAEARLVAETCAELGWPHAVARWSWDGQGNVMDAARRARLGLIDRWRGRVGNVLMAHTADDVAETFVMRLARGSGLDGLAAMPAVRVVAPEPVAGDIEGACPPRAATGSSVPLRVVRPCLGMARDDLRHYLRTLKGRWVEDPTNADPRFDRARVRAAMETLGTLGIGREALAAAATRLADERTAADHAANALWRRHGRSVLTPGMAPTGVVFFRGGLPRDTPAATVRRLLKEVVRFVSGTEYAPRGRALERFRDRLASGGDAVLHGVEAMHHRDTLWLFREAAAAADRRIMHPETRWDERFALAHDALAGLSVGILGTSGWLQARGTVAKPDMPHRAVLSLPALWRDDTLVACDGIGFLNEGALPCAVETPTETLICCPPADLFFDPITRDAR